MKNLLTLSAASLFLALSTIPGAALPADKEREVMESTQNRFIGAWRLVRLEEQGADGTMHDADCTGMLVFTSDGRMSVQVMYRNAQTGSHYAQGGYEATFGRYEIDASANTFTFHVEGALVRTLLGKDLVRAFELSGNRLIVKSSNPNERWRVTWEHY